jgi:aspartate dehydrogenase
MPARLGCRFTSDPANFLAEPMDLVVEAAGHDAVRRYGADTLRAGKDLMVVAIGALADPGLYEQLTGLAAEHGRRLYISAGAIAGLDAISAGAIGDLQEVTHFIRKAPRSILPPEEAAQVQRSGEARELFVGTAREAAPRFPENVNVAAAVSLAGVGLDRTQVRVVADPSVSRNTHEVVARGDFGELRVLLQNVPTEANPKTGKLTSMSLIKAIRNLTAPVVVGV